MAHEKVAHEKVAHEQAIRAILNDVTMVSAVMIVRHLTATAGTTAHGLQIQTVLVATAVRMSAVR